MMALAPIEELRHEFTENSTVLCRGLYSTPLLLAASKLQLIIIELMARVEAADCGIELAECGGES